ncbi:MAG TPA: phenylalanine--tRNA ligase subunit beta [Longimicrobiales bacterium]
MNISYRWLTELLPGLALTPRQVADRLAMLGAPVDEIVDLGGPLRDILIARVLRTERHPNADRLSLCTVDAGVAAPLQVVCGAANVKAGAYYPFAPVGASLPGGITIRKAKIRGTESQGMLCSERELGLGRDHQGILELHGEFEPGRSFIESAGLDDVRLVVDVTPNRPDLLSHIGIAREIAAAEGLTLRLHDLPGSTAAAEPHVAPHDDVYIARAAGVTVRIDDPDLCPHYFGLVIRDVQVGPSPEWLASRLRAIGLRPISNVVDATNYVLQELGHPLHAFDLDRLGDTVVVRRARSGERITTLDGTARRLTDEMLVIADAERPVAVAGVMGGADTEVHDGTRNILLECAIFEPRAIRGTRRALGLSTDASYRFERGVDPHGTMTAMARTASLILAVAGGTAESRGAFAGSDMPPLPEVALRLDRVEQVLGMRFDADTIRDHLRPLGFDVSVTDEHSLRVAVPGYRGFDVHREDDLIEEIARRHGYDAFPDELRPFRPSVVPTHPLFVVEDRLRTLLVARGMLEARTAAFAPASEGDVELLLPLAATESRLRRSLVPGLIHRAESNFARGARSVRLFEIGTVFAAAQDGALPAESTRLALVLSGPARRPHWTGDTPAFDVWDLKAVAEDVARALGLAVRAAQQDDRVAARDPAGDGGLPPGARDVIDPALSFRLSAPHDQDAIGYAGRVRDGVVDAPAWADDVWVLEVELSSDAGRPPVEFAELPQYPAVERDLALLVGVERRSAEVVDAIRAAGGVLLESAEPFDQYTGAGVPEDRRSIAYRLRFRAPDRTLTDAEVDAAVRRVLTRLGEDLGVQQRA